MIDTVPPGWKRVQRPSAFFRRYDFKSYVQTRRYLELLGEESKRTGCYPDLSFGPRHVNVTVPVDDSAADMAVDFARSSDDLAERAASEGFDCSGVAA